MSSPPGYVKAVSSTDNGTNHSIHRILQHEKPSTHDHCHRDRPGQQEIRHFNASVSDIYETNELLQKQDNNSNHSCPRKRNLFSGNSHFDHSSDSDEDVSPDSEEQGLLQRYQNSHRNRQHYFYNYPHAAINDIIMNNTILKKRKNAPRTESEYSHDPLAFNDSHFHSLPTSSHFFSHHKLDMISQREEHASLPTHGDVGTRTSDFKGLMEADVNESVCDVASCNTTHCSVENRRIEYSSKTQKYLTNKTRLDRKDTNKKGKCFIKSGKETGNGTKTSLDTGSTIPRKILDLPSVVMSDECSHSTKTYCGKDSDCYTCGLSTTKTMTTNIHGSNADVGMGEHDMDSDIVSNVNGFPLPDDDKSNKFRVKESDVDNLSLTKSGVTVTLLNSSLWMAFHRVGTEMIINRGGRRMFPYLSLSVQGLNPSAHYTVSIQITPASTRRCKFINSKWVPVGLADTESTQLPHYHLDSPSLGYHWNRNKINFSKIKLTNNKESSPHNILLHSMHKYRIITTFTRVDYGAPSDATSLSFHFPETDFIAVTAYQNESVTQMKIHNNPFAKAFRDATFTEIRKRIALRKRKHTQGRMRLSTTGVETARMVPSSFGDNFVYRLVTPMSMPSSLDTSFTWPSFQSTGCIMAQCPSMSGLCVPWGTALPATFPGGSLYQPGVVNINGTPEPGTMSTMDSDDVDSISQRLVGGDDGQVNSDVDVSSSKKIRILKHQIPEREEDV